MERGKTGLFRQLFDPESSTYAYLLADARTRRAVLIDPVLEQVDRDLELVDQLGLRLAYVPETHVHADHVTGAGALKARTGAQIVASTRGADCTDIKVGHGDVLRVGDLEVEVLETPGHTDDSVSYRVGANVFSGDALFIRGTGRTDFQNGDAGQLYDSVTKVLFSLPGDTLVWPGHDYRGMTVTTIDEERRHNPRLACKARDEFIVIMNTLFLPTPKNLDVAVPANRRCGMKVAAQVGV